MTAWENFTITQGQLFLPRPDDPDLFDLIMIEAEADSTINSFYQPRAIHMLFDVGGGTGNEMLVGDELIFGSNLTERLTGTPHANGTDYWILMHEWKSDKFLAYLLSADGLDTVPVVSHAGAVHSAEYGSCLTNRNNKGEMKFSYAGDKVAICSANGVCGTQILQPNIVQLFHFNDSTGIVSYWMTLPAHLRTYGIEFSQDGTKLYVPGVDDLDRYVDQYDLASSDTLAIQGSRTRVFALPYNGSPTAATPCALELAPNGKIYVSHSGSSMDVIQWPDLPGLACGYMQAGLVLPSPVQYASHNNHIKRYHDSEYKRDDVGLGAERKKVRLNMTPNPATGTVGIAIPSHIALPRLVVTDALGRPVQEFGSQTTRSGILDVSALASGLYTMTLYDGHTVSGSERLVVHH